MEISEQSAGLRRYADVLRAPGVGRIAAAALLARLPIGMAPLATVLLVRGEGRSYAVAGVVVAATSLASAIGWPLWGRLIDRGGQARILLPLAVVYPAALAGLALAATYGARPGGIRRTLRGHDAAGRCVHARTVAEPARDPGPA